MNVSCLAILCVRNEELYIETTIRDLIEQGIDVAVIDNGSNDRSKDICKKYYGKGLLLIEDMPWSGCFNQYEMLEAKWKIVNSMAHDWIIHHDADEWLQSPIDGETLLEGINRVSRDGFNVINFDEFVFLPEPGCDYRHTNYRENMLNYYFFEPEPLRLMRAWKNDGSLKGFSEGGHSLIGKEIKVALEPFVLRHYITLSQEHIINKYVGRRFAEVDLRKSWHGNRLNLCERVLALPDIGMLKTLPNWESKSFDRRNKKLTHFWSWRRSWWLSAFEYIRAIFR